MIKNNHLLPHKALLIARDTSSSEDTILKRFLDSGMKRNKLQYLLYSPFVWLTLRLKGIKSERSYFNGFPYFHRANKSSIEIGRNSRFNSRTTSNLIPANVIAGGNPCVVLKEI
ncbi:MAG: hypothetical protein Q4G63_08995 [Bacteroidia bacterium]|nr:hypothetical protein [Bacteroidia bacterium]